MGEGRRAPLAQGFDVQAAPLAVDLEHEVVAPGQQAHLQLDHRQIAGRVAAHDHVVEGLVLEPIGRPDRQRGPAAEHEVQHVEQMRS